MRTLSAVLLLFVLSCRAEKSSPCEDYLSCRSQVLQKHLVCLEAIRKTAAGACRLEHEFRQFQVASLRKEAQFSICIGKQSQFQKQQLCENASTNVVNIALSCMSTLDESFRHCDTAKVCCPPADACSTELAVSWLSRETRRISNDLLKGTARCKDEMATLIAQSEIASDDVDVANGVIGSALKLEPLFSQDYPDTKPSILRKLRHQRSDKANASFNRRSSVGVVNHPSQSSLMYVPKHIALSGVKTTPMQPRMRAPKNRITTPLPMLKKHHEHRPSNKSQTAKKIIPVEASQVDFDLEKVLKLFQIAKAKPIEKGILVDSETSISSQSGVSTLENQKVLPISNHHQALYGIKPVRNSPLHRTTVAFGTKQYTQPFGPTAPPLIKVDKALHSQELEPIAKQAMPIPQFDSRKMPLQFNFGDSSESSSTKLSEFNVPAPEISLTRVALPSKESPLLHNEVIESSLASAERPSAVGAVFVGSYKRRKSPALKMGHRTAKRRALAAAAKTQTFVVENEIRKFKLLDRAARRQRRRHRRRRFGISKKMPKKGRSVLSSRKYHRRRRKSHKIVQQKPSIFQNVTVQAAKAAGAKTSMDEKIMAFSNPMKIKITKKTNVIDSSGEAEFPTLRIINETASIKPITRTKNVTTTTTTAATSPPLERKKIVLSSCEMYAACMDELHSEEDKCLPEYGRLLPGLPGRRIGNCNKHMVQKYQKLDLSLRELEAQFAECLFGEILSTKQQHNSTRLPSHCTELPKIPSIDEPCQKRMSTIKRVCDKYARCCEAAGRCRARVDSTDLAKTIAKEKQTLSDEAAQCQIDAERQYQQHKIMTRKAGHS